MCSEWSTSCVSRCQLAARTRAYSRLFAPNRHLSERDANDLFLKQGETFETQGKLREAEKMYLKIREPDLAIAMYKNHKQVRDEVSPS